MSVRGWEAYLAYETQRRQLRQQIVDVTANARMRMSSNESDVRFRVNAGIELFELGENASPHRSIARGNVWDENAVGYLMKCS